MTHPISTFAEDLPVGVCRLTDRLVVREVNAAFLQLLDLRRDDSVDRPLGDLLRGESSAVILGALKASHLERTSRNGIVEFQGQNASLRAAAYAVAPSGKNDLVLVLSDITAETAEAKAMRESLKRFHEFLDQSPFIAWIRDAKERYVYLNDTYRSHYGLQPRDRLGRTPFDVWPSETAWQFHRNDMRVLAAGVSRSVVEHAPDPDGTMRTWFNVKFPIATENAGTMIGGVGLDITSHEQTHERLFAERLKTEREKVEEEARLVNIQKLQSLALLVSGAAHDINNMLAAIQVYAGVLKQHHATAPEVVECVDHISEASEAALRLSRQMLSLYRRSGPAVRQPVNLSELICDLRLTLESVVHSPHLLRMDLASDLPPTWGDLLQLRQVILNLVVNADESMGASAGDVRVQTRLLPAENDTPERIELVVSDNGMGIQPEVLPRIFDPFFTTKHEGTGLGLAAVKAILATHDASIEIDTKTGQGTTFRIIFPATR